MHTTSLIGRGVGAALAMLLMASCGTRVTDGPEATVQAPAGARAAPDGTVEVPPSDSGEVARSVIVFDKVGYRSGVNTPSSGEGAR